MLVNQHSPIPAGQLLLETPGGGATYCSLESISLPCFWDCSPFTAGPITFPYLLMRVGGIHQLCIVAAPASRGEWNQQARSWQFSMLLIFLLYFIKWL